MARLKDGAVIDAETDACLLDEEALTNEIPDEAASSSARQVVDRRQFR